MTATLTDTNYRRSPLFQGGLEIQCKVEVEMPSTMLAQKLIGRFREMVDKLYDEPEHLSTNLRFILVNLRRRPKKLRKLFLPHHRSEGFSIICSLDLPRIVHPELVRLGSALTSKTKKKVD